MIEATLRPTEVAEPVLKDTLSEVQQATIPALLPPPPLAAQDQATAPAKSEPSTRQKQAKDVYYPPEAIADGIEGTVKLLLTLTADGKVLDAQVASGSGHAVLDQAAVRAAFAMGALPGLDKTEMILPVVFRLQP